MEKNDKHLEEMVKRQDNQEAETTKLQAKVCLLENQVKNLMKDREHNLAKLNEYKAQASHQICVIQQKLGLEPASDELIVLNDKPTGLKKKLSQENSLSSGNESPKKVPKTDKAESINIPTHD